MTVKSLPVLLLLSDMSTFPTFSLCFITMQMSQADINRCIKCMSSASVEVCFLLWGGQQGASERQAVGSLPRLLARAVPDTILLVHHLLQQRLVVSVERCHRDIPHSTKLTTVIQVLVLQTEEVPHKTPAEKKTFPRVKFRFFKAYTDIQYLTTHNARYQYWYVFE